MVIEVNGDLQEHLLQKGENIIPLKLKRGKDNIITISAPNATKLSEKDERSLSFLMSYYLDKIARKGE